MKTHAIKFFLLSIVAGAAMAGGVGYAFPGPAKAWADPVPASSKSNGKTEQPMEHAKELPYESVYSSELGLDHNKTVPANINEWYDGKRLTEFQGVTPFDGASYVAVSRGECSNPGYNVKLIGVYETDHEIIVKVKYINPDPDKTYIQMITHPSILFKVNKDGKPFRFVIEK